jgi:hypothetical protein
MPSKKVTKKVGSNTGVPVKTDNVARKFQRPVPKKKLPTAITVLEAIERERRTASTRSLDMSFNELASMYENTELIIQPDYQRTFRWSEEKCSQFIESIILEMPIPPIYLVELEEGSWELIDGLQRLSTYLYLRGMLKHDPNSSVFRDKCLTLRGCDIVLELNGLRFDDLPTAVQHRIRRATFRIELVKRASDKRFAYHMFKRLNTGGELLSPQELRNCSIRLLGTRFNDFLVDMSRKSFFLDCICDLTEEQKSRRISEELVLRFFAF